MRYFVFILLISLSSFAPRVYAQAVIPPVPEVFMNPQTSEDCRFNESTFPYAVEYYQNPYSEEAIQYFLVIEQMESNCRKRLEVKKASDQNAVNTPTPEPSIVPSPILTPTYTPSPQPVKQALSKTTSSLAIYKPRFLHRPLFIPLILGIR